MLLNRLDKEAESQHISRSETLRKILTDHFKEKTSGSTPSTSENKTIDVLLSRLNNIDE